MNPSSPPRERQNGHTHLTLAKAQSDVPKTNAPPEPAPPPPAKDKLDLPPHTVETEECLLGAILMNPAALRDCRAVLNDDGQDFYILRNGWIWEALCQLQNSDAPIDNRTLAELLRVKPDPTTKHANRLEAVGGEAYLNYLPGMVPTALHAEIYAIIIERAALRRALLGVASEMSKLAYDEDRDIKTVLAESEAALDKVLHRLTVRDYSDAPTLAARVLDDLLTDKGEVWPTGFIELDKVLGGGLEPQRMMVLAGRPGMGKTTMMIVMAFNMAYRYNRPCLVISLEMSEDQLMHRVYSRLLKTPRDQFHTIKDSAKMRQYAEQAKRVYSALPVWINDAAGTTPADIHLLALQMERIYQKKPVIFIDHLQRAASGVRHLDYGDNDFSRVSLLAKAYKNLAKELNTAVVVLSQLNREVETRHDKRPQLSDLRQSGRIEEEADAALFLYRPYYYLSEAERIAASDMARIMLEVNAAKVRDGAPKTIYLKAMLEHNAVFNTAWGGEKGKSDLGIDWRLERFFDDIGAQLHDGLALPANMTNSEA